MLDHTTQFTLDDTLEQFYGLLREGASFDAIDGECKRIIAAHTGKGYGPGILVRDNWRDTWETHEWLASGWFSGPGLTRKMADALFDLFTEMARFVMDPGLRRLHRGRLKRCLYVYLRRQRIPIRTVRPPKPTRRYCLRRGGKVRWKGEEKVQRRHYDLLGYMLDAGKRAVPFNEIRREVFGGKNVSSKRIQNAVSELNDALLKIGFPAQLHTKNARVYFDPPL